jgi:hypothetical protein
MIIGESRQKAVFRSTGDSFSILAVEMEHICALFTEDFANSNANFDATKQPRVVFKKA